MDRFPVLVLLASLWAAPVVDAQSTVQSRFLRRDPISTQYSKPENWAPAEVPNNTEERWYDVTIDPDHRVTVDIDATISNLTLAGTERLPFSAGLYITGTTFSVTGTTLNQLRDRTSVISVRAGGEEAIFDAGTLSTFTGSALRGSYELAGSAAAATLRFRGADVVELVDGQLRLDGTLTSVVDENGNDGLRNLRRIDSASQLVLNDRTFIAREPFTNEGALVLGYIGRGATLFTAAAGLTNFDPASGTLSGGRFSLGVHNGLQPTELRFAGADIVNNGSVIDLAQPTARITDLAGVDALRNLARNLPGASLTLYERDFATVGDFTNDGTLKLVASTFTVAGRLTNFDPATRTLHGGIYEGGTFRFRGADIESNAAGITYSPGAIVDELGRDALRNLREVLEGGALVIPVGVRFTAPGDFLSAGTIQTDPFFGGPAIGTPPDPGTFSVRAGHRCMQTGGRLLNDGIFSANHLEILGGVASGSGTVFGNVSVGEATIHSDFANRIRGNLRLTDTSTLHHVARRPHPYEPPKPKTTGDVVLAGTLEIEIIGELLLPSTETLIVLESSRPLSGAFANAPHGTRLTTIDGSGSFVVIYDDYRVKLAQFQVNPPTARLLNISTRGYLKEAATDVIGHRHLIGGFIITGVEPKTIIARGVGPSLARRGVTEPLNDPKLGLHQSGVSGPIATNDNWGDTAEIDWSGLAPEDSRESAMKVTLAPGAYTVVMEEAAGLAGTGLIEIYDVSPRSNSKLGNLSTRGFFETGDVLIGGIIVAEGEANAEVVVRALGPTLQRQAFYLNAVADPTLEVRDNNGELLAFDDGETESGESGEVPRELEPFFNEDCAMRLSLPRGFYTALVRSKRGSRGAAIVEFYDLRR